MMKSMKKTRSSDQPAPQDAIALLDRIPADLPYSNWFRVAAALKNSSVEFKVFDQWSQTAPDKYDAEVCERVWADVGVDGKRPITIGTLCYIAAQYNGVIIPAPPEMLLPPAIDERPRQIAEFLELMFRQGESYELVTTFFINGKGKKCPDRSKSVIAPRDESELTDENQEILSSYKNYTEGALVSLNPIKHIPPGKAPTDADVTDCRYALIEADDLSKEEQWQKLCELNLPVAAVVWSGGKSLHTIVKIDAGNNRELYKERIGKLYDYLKSKGFPADAANKNPSRLTRLPGIQRGEDMQYLVAREFGPKDWDTFERMFLVKLDRRSETSPGNGKKGGRHFMSVTKFAKQFLSEHSRDGMSLLQYWGGDWWRFEDGIWKMFPEEELRIQVTSFLQKLSVDKDGRISTVLINDTILNLKGLCGLIGITMPCWLPDGKDASDIVCFSNGVLSIEKLISENEQVVKPHTPTYFGVDCVEYAYDSVADCPRWKEYLQTTFDDEDSRIALQMMFGYVLSGKLDKNIGFFLIGRGGDGKSVAAHILRKLVGESQTCCLPFTNLGDRFSSYLLTENKLNLVEELPVSADIYNISDAEKIFKMVTDGAVIPVERKFHSPQEKRAKARCIFLANELPLFVDRSNGLWDRLIILPFTNRFRDTDSEKANLKYELETELPGIFNWAIAGARKLETLPRFPVPQASREYLAKHRLACDHEAAFLHEAVITDPEGFCPKQELYKTYRQWTEAHGYKPFGADRFNAAVKATFPDAQEKRQRSPYDWLVWEGIRFSEGTITEKE